MLQRLASRTQTSQHLLHGLALVLLSAAAVMLGAGAAPAQRVILLRYASLLGVGALAVAPPHVLLPDPRVALVQLLTPPPEALLGRQLRRWMRPVAFLAVPVGVLAFYDPGGFVQHLPRKVWYLLEGLSVLGGAALYSLLRYATMGRRAQTWQEGNISPWYRSLKEHSTTGSFGVPDGLVPAITASGRIFLAGVLVVAAGAYVGQRFAPAPAWVPGAVLAAGAGARLARLRRTYDRHFYGTDAFYREIFRAGGVRGAERAPVVYAAVYWVPRRWRPHVWAGLRQMDRRLPLGRLVAAGHLFFWLLLFQDVTPAVVAAYLLLFVVAQNGACIVLAGRAFAPSDFQHVMQSAVGWMLTRSFVNLRWAFPFALSLLAAAALDGAFGFGQALAWIGLDLVLALATAALVTYLAEGQYRRRYA